MAEPEIDLGGIGRAIVANRRWVIAPTVLALLASAAFVNIVKPQYTAETRVLLEMQDGYTPRTDKNPEVSSGGGPQLDPEAVGSQIQLVTSRDVARRAIKSIGLLGNPEFDPLANGLGALSRLMVLAGLKRDPTSQSPEDRVMEKYFDKLTVYSPTKTRIVNIEFQASDPDLAAKAANSIANIYLEFQQDAKRQAAGAAAASLATLVADLKQRTAAAESKAEEFRAETGLLTGANNTTIDSQQLAEVNTELSRARTAQADGQAKAKLIRDMLKAGRVSEIPDVANNDLIRRISEQRVSMKAQLALESRTLLPGHPRIKELNAQLADLDEQLRAVADKTARTLENDAKLAGARVDNLQAALDAQKKVVGGNGADEVKMRDLDRAANQLKDELEAATQKYQEALARESSKATPADARVVSRAVAPQLPSFPKKLPIIAFSTIAALVLSLAAVVARQLASDRQRRPRIAAPAPIETLPVEAVEAHGEQAVAETAAVAVAKPRVAVEPAALAAALAYAETVAQEDRDGALVLIACNDADDRGFSLALGRALARDGRAVLVSMDGVARLPLHPGAGLGDVFAGKSTFGDTIHRDPVSRLHMIGPGERLEADASALWSTLDALRGAYDFVVLAASRNLDVDEAAAIAHLATNAVVVGAEPGAASELAAALVRSGLPQPAILAAGADAGLDAA
ncbi:MAG: lipopolysaccharide biosynthesis protein [Hyphomicrobiales bacterium]|nr:lipopolysaccharide biosynthesis protein [Hyphomicrobiales bacterium]